MNYEWKVKIIDRGYTDVKDVFIYRRRADQKTELLRGDVVEILSEGSVDPLPSLRLDPEALQAFADGLEQIGIKPQKGFLEGKLESTEKHLEDMRTLVFKKK